MSDKFDIAEAILMGAVLLLVPLLNPLNGPVYVIAGVVGLVLLGYGIVKIVGPRIVHKH